MAKKVNPLLAEAENNKKDNARNWLALTKKANKELGGQIEDLLNGFARRDPEYVTKCGSQANLADTLIKLIPKGVKKVSARYMKAFIKEWSPTDGK